MLLERNVLTLRDDSNEPCYEGDAMTAINLPPLPDVLSCDPRINGQLVHHIRSYARAAVEADRQRGEPTHWLCYWTDGNLSSQTIVEGPMKPDPRDWTAITPLYARPPSDAAEVLRLADEYAKSFALWDRATWQGQQRFAEMQEDRAALLAYLEGKA